MGLIRKTALAQPPFDTFVLLDDGSGDLWWIDADGDLLFWDEEGPPMNMMFEIRTTQVKMADTDDNSAIEKAFSESKPSNMDWPAWLSSR